MNQHSQAHSPVPPLPRRPAPGGLAAMMRAAREEPDEDDVGLPLPPAQRLRMQSADSALDAAAGAADVHALLARVAVVPEPAPAEQQSAPVRTQVDCFDARFGKGASAHLAAHGLFVTESHLRGAVLNWKVQGRGPDGRSDPARQLTCIDTGADIQIAQRGEPDPELMARTMVEMARLKGWKAIDIASDGPLAAKVREHIVKMGMPVLVPGGNGALMQPKSSESAETPPRANPRTSGPGM